jgi:flagellar basal body rod protein FlgG
MNGEPRMIENAQLIGLSRQMALQRQMDVVANNLANINSTGFKAEASSFPTCRIGRPCTTSPPAP